MFGVAVFGHRATLSRLDIGGAPKDDVTISGRANGNSYAHDISILDSVLSGAGRNAISATSVIGLRIERNTIQGVRDAPPGQPAAGIDLEPDSRECLRASDVHIVGQRHPRQRRARHPARARAERGPGRAGDEHRDPR